MKIAIKQGKAYGFPSHPPIIHARIKELSDLLAAPKPMLKLDGIYKEK